MSALKRAIIIHNLFQVLLLVRTWADLFMANDSLVLIIYGEKQDWHIGLLGNIIKTSFPMLHFRACSFRRDCN